MWAAASRGDAHALRVLGARTPSPGSGQARGCVRRLRGVRPAERARRAAHSGRALASGLGPAPRASRSRRGRRPAPPSKYDELARRAWGTPRVLGVSARTRGLLAGGEPGLVLLREAVEAHAGSPARLEHAYSLTELGAALRRAGRRTEAVDVLRSAGETAEHCGAAALVARVRGGHRRRWCRWPAVRGCRGRGLDAERSRVARMAASGGTNRQIGETG